MDYSIEIIKKINFNTRAYNQNNTTVGKYNKAFLAFHVQKPTAEARLHPISGRQSQSTHTSTANRKSITKFRYEATKPYAVQTNLNSNNRE